MLLATVLGSELITKLTSWDTLRLNFFDAYRMNILKWCGFDTEYPQIDLIEAANLDFLIALFSGMKQSGMLGDCSYQLLATHISLTYKTKYTAGAICSRLKKFNPNAAYYSEIQRLVKYVRKRDKNN